MTQPFYGRSLTELMGGDAPQTFDPAYAQATAQDAVDLAGEAGLPQQDPRPAIQKITHEFDEQGRGTVTIKGTDKAAEYLQGLIQEGLQQRAIGNLRASILRQRRETLDAHPILAGVGRIAALAGAGYAGSSRAGPLARALGAYGGEYFGQTTDQLAAEEQAAIGESIRAQTPIIAGLEAEARGKEAEARQAELTKYHEEREADRAVRQKQQTIEEWQKVAMARRLPSNLEERLRADPSIKPEEVDTMAESLRSMQASAQSDYEDKQKEIKQRDEMHKAQLDYTRTARQAALDQTKAAKATPIVMGLSKLDDKEAQLSSDAQMYGSVLDSAAADVGTRPPRREADGSISVQEANRVRAEYTERTKPGNKARRDLYGLGFDERAEKERQAILANIGKAIGFFGGYAAQSKRIAADRAPLLTVLRKVDADTADAYTKAGQQPAPGVATNPNDEATRFLNGLQPKK